jgi:hypothetical protein
VTGNSCSRPGTSLSERDIPIATVHTSRCGSPFVTALVLNAVKRCMELSSVGAESALFAYGSNEPPSETPMSRQRPQSHVTHRRDALKGIGTLGLAAILPWSDATSQSVSRQETLRLGPGGAILNVPENRAVLIRLEQAPELSPEQLLSVASFYRDHPTTATVANRLAWRAVAMLAGSAATNRAMASIAKTEIEWSFLGDVWTKVKNFFTGGTNEKDPSKCRYKCLGLVVYSVLVEKCGDRDDWHVIGLCSGFKW